MSLISKRIGIIENIFVVILVYLLSTRYKNKYDEIWQILNQIQNKNPPFKLLKHSRTCLQAYLTMDTLKILPCNPKEILNFCKKRTGG